MIKINKFKYLNALIANNRIQPSAFIQWFWNEKNNQKKEVNVENTKKSKQDSSFKIYFTKNVNFNSFLQKFASFY